MRRSITLVVHDEIVERTYHYSRFADELRLSGSSPISIVRRLTPDADGNGFILVHQTAGLEAVLEGVPHPIPESITRRVLILQAVHDDLTGPVHSLGLAGAIPTAPWLHWAEGSWPDGGSCEMYGLRSIAAELGVDTDPRHTHPTYCMLGNRRSLDLPSLVIAYLDAVQRLLPNDPWIGFQDE